MKFYTLDPNERLPRSAVFPCAQLEVDSWNDFGYTTLFSLTYYPRKGKAVPIGGVKILTASNDTTTTLKKSFTVLNEDFCSLGQSVSYYKELAKLPKRIQSTILTALRDIAHQPHIAEAFRDLEGFKTSLLRFSEAEKAFHEGGQLLTPDVPKAAPIAFRFSIKLEEAAVPHVLDVELGDDETLPDRMIALVGKNGTGKTWLLGRLAASLSGDEVDVGVFEPNRPPFSRIVATAYSAFDTFNKPTEDRTFSYRYCGIYDEQGVLSTRPQLFAKVRQAVAAIIDQGRRKEWDRAIKPLLGEEAMIGVNRYLFQGGEAGKRTARERPKLSSGQLVLLVTLSEVIAAMEDDSLILFDEPELHLHPNAIATLFSSLQDILTSFKSYAIIATHSPLILQQIPSKYVRLFSRFGDSTIIKPLPIECFGENLTVITQEVFQVSSSPSLYREWLTELHSRMSIEEIVALFPKGLSFNAKSVLYSGGSENA